MNRIGMVSIRGAADLRCPYLISARRATSARELAAAISRRSSIRVITLFCLFGYCLSADLVVLESPTQTELADLRAESMIPRSIEETLRNSPSYQDLKSQSRYAGFAVDSETPDSVDIAIGEDFPDHFTRRATIRICKNSGAIFKQKTSPAGDFFWQDEYTPAGWITY